LASAGLIVMYKTMKYKLHISIRDSLRRPDNGKQVLRIGLCAGYWPCLLAPFIQISLGKKIVDIWFGLPGYKNT